MANIDKRIVKITIITKSERIEYAGLEMSVKGDKLTNTSSANADVEIYNVSHSLRQYILSHAMPKGADIGSLTKIVVEVGRESYGSAVLFEGQIFKATQTDKPNIGLKLNCIAGYSDKSRIVSHDGIVDTSLKRVSQLVASDLGVILNFKSKDFKIKNYHYLGSANNQLHHLSELAGIKNDVFIDKGKLIVKPKGTPIESVGLIDLSKGTGLIRANATQAGCTILMLYDPEVSIGSKIKLKTIMNDSLNGMYEAFKVSYSITSRDRDFYLQVECMRISN